MDDEYQRDQDLRERQGGRTFRIGGALRNSFHPRSDDLEPAITRLMLELSREEQQAVRPCRAPPPSASTPGLLERLVRRLRSS